MTSDLGALPSRFGRYEVLGLIGTGSFADVVRAWDGGLASHVAIKVLTPEANDDELARERFIEEGKLLRRVHNPHVLSVHDLGELDDGRPYLVIALADGGTLDDRIDGIEGQPVDARTIARITEAIATGLDALHAAGVVHRDIKPENLLIETGRAPDSTGVDTVLGGNVFGETERLLIGDLGLAKDLANRGSSPSVVGGSARYQAPEQLRADGVLGPPTDLYAASSVLWRLLTGHVAPEPQDIDVALAVFRPGWQRFFTTAMAMDPAARYPTATAWRSAVLDHLDVEPLAVAEGGRTFSTSRACPYKGLAAFQPSDADVFFGREDLVDDLIQRLQTNRVLVVAGPSGSGKSSLVRAGLLPALRDGALPGSDGWRYELFTPGAEPFDELHYRLTRNLDGMPRVSAEELAADPRTSRRLIDDAIEAAGGTGPGSGAWLLYIDQFEEVFTQPDDAGTARALVDALSAMVDPADSQLRVVLAVRADFYGRCAQIPWLAHRITENQVLVGPMSNVNMRRAIEEPARRHGLRFEPGLVDAVLEEGGSSAGSLPLISHALVETWSRREGSMLTLEGFAAAGGVGGAIAQSADALYEIAFDEAQQRAARRLMLRLVTPGEGTADTRRRLPLTELERDSEPELMSSVVDEFVTARLLAVDEKTVEIAHEALINGWPRLHDWIDSERENLRFRQRVGRAAGEWESAGHDPDLLWRGTPLAAAVDWSRENPDGLDRLESEFIEAAETARLNTAEEQARRTARAQRTRRLATTALAGLALASVIASVVAFLAFRRASNNSEVAERQFANALGTSALGKAEADPRQALLLAMESGRTATATVDARAAMIQARLAMTTEGAVPLGPPVNTPGSFNVALRPDGGLAAVADPTGPIRLYDVATGDRVGDVLDRHTRGARTMTFTSDGASLISGSADGFVLRWDLTEPAEVPPPTIISETTGLFVWSVAIDPDDTHVAVGNDDATVRVFDLATGDEVERLDWDDGSGGIIAVAFSPDGSKLIATNRNGRTNGWSTNGYRQLWDPDSTPTGPKQWEIVFTPDGTRFATAGDGPTATLHDAETGLLLDGYSYGDQAGPGAVATAITGIAISTDGRRLIGGSAAGTVHTWSLDDPDAAPTTSRAGHRDGVLHGDISADGSIYATVAGDKQLRFWQAGAVPIDRTFEVAGGAYGAAFDPAGERLAVGDGDGRLHVLTIDGGTEATASDGHDGPIWDVVWSPDGSWIATIGEDGRVVRWNPDTVSIETDIGRHRAQGRSLALSPDGRYLVSSDRGDSDGLGADVFVWATETTSLHEQLMGHEQGVRATAFSPNGELLATADGNGEIRIWNTSDYSLARQWSTFNTVWALSFSRDGQLASVDSSEDVRVFDPATGEQVGTTVSGLGTNGASGVGFDADGLTAAVVTRRGDLHLVDWQQGVNLASVAIPAHTGEEAQSFELTFDPTMTTFATTGTDGTVRVWDILSPERACNEAATRLDPTIEADLFAGSTPLACAER